MAEVNGKEVVLQGKSYAEIGELLWEASPAGDGTGLTVSLTLLEKSVILRDYQGMTMRMAMEEILAKAIKRHGGDPHRVFCTYSGHLFETELK